MSKILKGLNEVNPHNYDSDWDYQDAVARSGKSRSSYRSQEDDTSDADITYSKKMYQLSQQQRDADHNRLATGTNEEQLDELSNEKLGQYKILAAANAGKADLAGDYKKADKRFSGIVKATKKQFANDTKPVKEDINVVYRKAKSLLTQLDENTQQRVINALTKSVDDEEQKTFKTGYPRVNNPKILGTQNRAKSAYYPPSKPNVKKLDKPLPENLGNELKSKSLKALQQVKQQLEQQRMADLEHWEKDFKQNTVSKFTAREPNLNQRTTSTSMVAMPGEKHSELKTRLGQLDKAIEKQGILDKMVQRLDKKGLLTPNIEAGVDTNMLVRDGARDNYVELNKKLDKALGYVKNRLLTNKAAYAKPKGVDEGWSQKYKSSINCSHPKGFSQKAHCAGKKKHNESIDNVMEMTCPDCGMCETHSDHENLGEACWKGYHKEGNKKMFGKTYPNCVKNKKKKTNEDVMGSLNELSVDLLQKAAQVAKDKREQAMNPKVHNALGGGYMNPLAKHYDAVNQKLSNRAVKVGIKDKVLKIASPALMRKMELEDIEEDNSRIARKPGQPAGSKKHSDLYTDENPKGTITGLKFATAEDARASVSKIRNSGRSHAHKIQAAVAMEQRAKAAGKAEAASVYRKYINATKKTEGVAEGELDEACWDTHKQVGMKKKGGKMVPDCVAKEDIEEQHSESCPHCGGKMVSEELMNEIKDACYSKVKSRYKVWPSAYASGALVKCRKVGAANWGNGGKKNESSILEGINRADESLHDWFNKEKWVRMDTKGKIKGPCAREPGEGKPKCLPQSKAHSLGKKGRASAAKRKRREDPNPERSGKAINVNTKKK